MSELNERQPLFAFDISIFFNGKVPRTKLLSRWHSMIENYDAEFACLRLKKVSVIVLLADYELWQIDLIKTVIDASIYHYVIPARTKDEFELFRDQFQPYTIFSNIPQRRWKGEYSNGVESYAEGAEGWLSIFNSLRETISY